MSYTVNATANQGHDTRKHAQNNDRLCHHSTGRDHWLRQGASAWLLVPAAASLALFVWLLSLHHTAAGRTYAAYGSVYVSVAVLWLWTVDGVRPDRWDLLGAAVALC